MKTIKELEKEIEEIERKEGDLEFWSRNWIVAKAKFHTLKDVLGLIDEMQTRVRIHSDARGDLGELKQKITGK